MGLHFMAWEMMLNRLQHFLVMAIVGGAFMPILQGLILDFGGSGYADTRIVGVPEVNFSFILPLMCFLVVALYGYRTFKVYDLTAKSDAN